MDTSVKRDKADGEKNAQVVEPISQEVIPDEIKVQSQDSDKEVHSSSDADAERVQKPAETKPASTQAKIPPAANARSAMKEDLIGFFTRPLLSKKKTDQLKELVEDADALHNRIDEVEGAMKELVKATAELQKMTGKALRRIFKDIEQGQATHAQAIESIVAELRRDYAGQASSSKQFQSAALAKVDDAAGVISGVNGSLTGIRGFLDENNKLVKRFEEGYDYQILKNFVRQIVRTISNIDSQIINVQNDDAREELVDARDDLVELLDRNGVEQIKPVAGSAYAGMEKYAEVAQEKIPTDDASKRGQIAAVDRIGYKYMFNDGQERVIQAARVKLFE